jgi:hypothetical protein
MIVKVTQEHIDKGQIGSSRSCPIALALKDTFKVKFSQVTGVCLTVGQFPENLVFTIPTPPKIMDFIEAFDLELVVEPFEFELSLEGVKL